jgi:hypothetical protein
VSRCSVDALVLRLGLGGFGLGLGFRVSPSRVGFRV